MGVSRAAPVGYPKSAIARDRFVLERRPARAAYNPWRFQGISVEEELAHDGTVARSATVFLTGRECPWRCVMCDLWRHTIAEDTPLGAIPVQLAAAREQFRRDAANVSQIKLYNAGSFFDPRAVPERDYPSIATALDGFAHVVVESHPALVGPRVDRWLEILAGMCHQPPTLEVAMGLETAHPDALDRLNKQMTLDGFARAADALARRSVAMRVFLLIAPPFVPDEEHERWLLRSVDVAFEAGAAVVALIPTRSGNGAIDALSAAGSFREPTLDDIERTVDAALAWSRGRGRLFVDLWDLERFSTCAVCFNARRDRLHAMNLAQQILPLVACNCEM
jgi:hypothetical protein